MEHLLLEMGTMSYALVISNAIQSEGGLPASARRLDNQAWVLGLPTATVALQQACGYFLVTDVAQPSDTATKTYDRSLTLVAGVPTVTWTQRDKTAQEIANATSISNRDDLLAQATAAMITLQGYIDQPDVNVASLAQAQTVCRGLQDAIQFEAQVLRRLIRLAASLLDGTD